MGGKRSWLVHGSSCGWRRLRSCGGGVRASTVSVRERWRAEIILLSAEGLRQQQIAEQMGLSRLAINRWVGRFARDRLGGLSDAPGRGRKPWLREAAAQQVMEQAVTPPPL